MTHLEILCYAIAHIDYLEEDLYKKRMQFDSHPDIQAMTDKMLGDLDLKKERLKMLYEIECGSKYAE